MKRLALLVLSATLILGGPALVGLRADALGEPAACGGPGQPPCPPLKPKEREPGKPGRREQLAPPPEQRAPRAREREQIERIPEQTPWPVPRQRQLEQQRQPQPDQDRQWQLEQQRRHQLEQERQLEWKEPHQPESRPTRPPKAVPAPPPLTRPDGFPEDGRRWSPGDRLPREFRQDRHAVHDWRAYNLPRPRSGHLWYCDWSGNCFLVSTITGLIVETRWRDELRYYWRERYVRLYGYRDDHYYLHCRREPDPAGILLGGLIGGLLGGALGDGDHAGAIFAGVIVGATMGAILTADLDCDDQSYAYRSYYDGLNGGIPGRYPWVNPRTRHHGEFMVLGFFYDPFGFYCADYRQTLWSPHRRVTEGYACRQPDGAWVFLR